ncbi:hypothetical protein [Leptothoe spongobia]|uniref:Uncharacterized protein n=1 Tax=Leptothoe spongobia TAU-MAC 1115 TaxID=1967444 RepID=A0A947DI31_9CYAN|nr:hypothetical protein [Leptothoe spongobia]MBT9317572.1 hypothetical protein [Leptothoe spongobia TAU-MAC 1115]
MSFQLSLPDSSDLLSFAQNISADIGNLSLSDFSNRSIRDVTNSLTSTSLELEPLVEAGLQEIDVLSSQTISQVLPGIVVSAESPISLDQTVADPGKDGLNNLPIEGQIVGERGSEDLTSSSQVSSQGFFDNFFRRTVARFDLNADLANEDSFYNLPYPFDLRLDELGRPELSDFPIWDDNPVIRGLRQIADDEVGFSTVTAGYFRFNRPLADLDPEDIIPADLQSPILLMDVDPTSPERGKLYPTIASTPRPDLNYVPDFLLSVGPAPGIVLHPKRQYAYVVQRSLRDIVGRRLDTPDTLERLLANGPPQNPAEIDAYEVYQPLRETLQQVGLSRRDIAIATVFTTGDPVGEMAQLSQQVVDRYDLTIENLRLDPDDGATHERFWEFHGTIEFPQFQQGTPPFNSEGLFDFTPDGLLVEQRLENAPVVITIPKGQFLTDEGFPLLMYQHGSNGLSTQVVDRGPILVPGGERVPGLGPAHVVAEYGIATVSSALPLNPERLENAPTDAYLNFANLAAYRDTFRQGVFEQRLLLEALEDLEIPAELIPEDDVNFRVDTDAFRVDTDAVAVLGQSLGAQFANMLGAIEPNVGVVIPTGSPGLWPLLISETELSDAAGLLLGTLQPLDPLYPGLQLLEEAWEVADPIVYAPYLAQRPLAGHPVRSVYKPVGQGDTEVPEVVFNAMALATGLRQSGAIIWPEMQVSLALDGLEGIEPYPVANNLLSDDGRPYTGVVVQYQGDGIADSHTIFSQLDEVKFQYANFLTTWFETDVAEVLDPLLFELDSQPIVLNA